MVVYGLCAMKCYQFRARKAVGSASSIAISWNTTAAWRHSQLEAAPTPAPRAPPVITADPSLMMFSTHAHNEPPKTIVVPEAPPQPAGKSKKAKKKAKRAAAETTEQRHEGAKMVTLRNPMFHPNLPPVQIANPAQSKAEIRIPDPIPMPPAPCQATITPTSNGMYTIRNPLMSMMHQQNLMGIRNQNPQMTPAFGQPQYSYVNPNVYTPQAYAEPARNSPKMPENDFQNRIMNLASFTQKNDEGYSLFKTPDENPQKSFLTPEYFDDQAPKVVSPNPIGTRPDHNRNYENDSLFANPIQRPEPIGTPLKKDEEKQYCGLYTPFGQEDRNVFRNALFNDKQEPNPHSKVDESTPYVNGELPYFQRLRAGSKLNNEVTIHYVTDSKFYKGQEACEREESLFSRPQPRAWPERPHSHSVQSSVSSMTCESACDSGGTSPPQHRPESSVFLPDRSITNLSSLEVSEREIESFKRFDFYFEPPQHKPKVQLDVRDIAAALRHHQK
ncbi:uncharacterized protein LOC125075427 [Vanessa atalanta]|uniref:uncharacterized protein LOC125075425 n=1 Tax=Vanessa atalanta TaxID=42275 RepID=UPI001FCD2D4D|nr:uncharacterized protein LOC125075425 [Vanessa atalanta]XP_047543124.1 uncharacterized protein LOC125075427 [Vanessa atalanta]